MARAGRVDLVSDVEEGALSTAGRQLLGQQRQRPSAPLRDTADPDDVWRAEELSATAAHPPREGFDTEATEETDGFLSSDGHRLLRNRHAAAPAQLRKADSDLSTAGRQLLGGGGRGEEHRRREVTDRRGKERGAGRPIGVLAKAGSDMSVGRGGEHRQRFLDFSFFFNTVVFLVLSVFSLFKKLFPPFFSSFLSFLLFSSLLFSSILFSFYFFCKFSFPLFSAD